MDVDLIPLLVLAASAALLLSAVTATIVVDFFRRRKDFRLARERELDRVFGPKLPRRR